MIEIALMGYGVVGSGVAEVCRMNQEIIRQRIGQDLQIKKILDVRDFADDPNAGCITHDPADIFEDPAISVVVEAIGGSGIAYDLTRQALQHRKHVVTSNKELVATYGPELMALARASGVSYMFEASVGGGIPIVRPLHKCLSANIIQTIAGILNGTTNYILTRMEQAGIEFSAALSEAQTLGYAEQNPSADISGLDSCRKIAILGSITFSEYIDYHLIHTEGISDITAADITWANRLGCKIKLLGCFRRQAGRLADLIVAPMLIPRQHPISVADDVNNAILVEGNALGEAMFYGRGAGRLPTASAVVADVIDCAMHLDKIPHLVPWIKTERQIVLPHASCPVQALVRLRRELPARDISLAFAGKDLVWLDVPDSREWAVLAGSMTEAELASALAVLDGQVISRIRLFQKLTQVSGT
jgi:homoserine dehydrogenase